MSSRTAIIKQRWRDRMDAGEIINCALCGEPIPRKAKGSRTIIRGGKGGLSVDHIIPKAHGGKDTISNLQPAHTKCNQDKGARLPHI